MTFGSINSTSSNYESHYLMSKSNRTKVELSNYSKDNYPPSFIYVRKICSKVLTMLSH